MRKYPFKHNEPEKIITEPFIMEDDADVVLTPEDEADLERFEKLSFEERIAEMKAETKALLGDKTF